jgi:RHS repeat-associated protein
MSTFFVGDPVDVITGAQFDVALDFRIAWPFPFEWRRFYNTARAGEYLPLGWGHTHSYDHRLKFDVDGLLYVDPGGTKHGFSAPGEGSGPSISGTGTLRRVEPQVYRVKVSGYPECEFHFTNPALPAQLRKVFLGRAVHELRYGLDGRWRELVYKAEPPVGIERDAAGRIVALVWRGAAGNGRDRILWRGYYDEGGNLIRVVDPYNATQTFTYDSAHCMLKRTDRRGYGFVASYDSDGRCIHSAGEDGMQGAHMRYLPAQHSTVVTRADGGAWQYFYETEGITRVIDPYGGVTRRTYGADGRLEREIGPMDEILRKIVDEESGLLRPPFTPAVGMCLPLGDPWFEPVRSLHGPHDALAWEGYGQAQCRNAVRFPSKESPWVTQLPRAVVKGIRFAEFPGEAKKPIKAVTTSTVVPPPKKAMGVPERPGVMRYDPFGLLVSHTLPTGQSCRWHYDPNGNVTGYIDYAGSEWRYEYASWNLRVRETDPVGNSVAYMFNSLEKPARVTDGGGTVTERTFDLKDRMTERRRHAELRDLFGYDRSYGLVSAATGTGDVHVALTIGPQRRPTKVAPSGNLVRVCAYDDQGRLVAVTEVEGEALTFAYATLGNWTADLRNGRGVERRYEASRVAECVVLGRFATRYAREPKTGRTTIIDPLGGRHVVQRLDPGAFLRQNANGVEEFAQFDWNGQCLAKVRFRPNEPGQSWSRTYRYSPVGALVSVSDSARGTSTYQYDAAHRLVGAVDADGAQSTFAYDRAGNLLSAKDLEGVFCEENRILTANGRRFEYNQRHHIARESGNGAARQYEYDAEDRLTSCRIGSTQITFRYDALGRRVSKATPDGVTEFIWDGERLAAEISPAGALRVYVYADGTTPTPFAFVDYESTDADPASGQRRYIFSNQVACPVRVEDEAGTELWRAQIDAYGRARISPHASIEFNLRWPGHYYDRETGLNYNRHRYYSPELARYIQVDPRDLDGGINVYAYPPRPLDQVDVDGLVPCPKKPMVTPDEGDEEFQQARQQADQLAEDLRNALAAEIAAQRAAGKNTQALENTTLTALVVQQDGEWVVVVTGNRSDVVLPARVGAALGDTRYTAYGDDRPPNVGPWDSHEDWRYPTQRPNGTTSDTSHTDAEQRGLRANDCDPNTSGVAYVAPTRQCCPGCRDAITTPTSDGGWGGSDANISDRGRGGQ